MSGMDATTGRRMDEDAHIRQSIRRILTTPVGSRLKRREFGSLVPDLVDHPADPANRLRLMSATVMAVIKWEPRVSVQGAVFSLDAAGRPVIDLEAVRTTGPRSGAAINLAIPLR